MSTPQQPSAEPQPQRRGPSRCARCALPPQVCLCAEVVPLTLATHVLVFQHRREVYRTSSTARLVTLALRHAEVRVIGRPEDRVHFADIAPPERTALLLHPTPHSRPLTREFAAGRPLTLVVPDGNWRQAFKLATKEAELAALVHVHLPPGAPSRYRLRVHPDPRYLATFEAIARALGILEGEDVQRALERVLERKVERTLSTRSRPPGD